MLKIGILAVNLAGSHSGVGHIVVNYVSKNVYIPL